MIQVRFKGYDLRLDPATPERIRSKDSESSRGCQAAAGDSHAVCNFLRMYYFSGHDIRLTVHRLEHRGAWTVAAIGVDPTTGGEK
jgi:hypothetical protein